MLDISRFSDISEDSHEYPLEWILIFLYGSESVAAENVKIIVSGRARHSEEILQLQ